MHYASVNSLEREGEAVSLHMEERPTDAERVDIMLSVSVPLPTEENKDNDSDDEDPELFGVGSDLRPAGPHHVPGGAQGLHVLKKLSAGGDHVHNAR